MSNSFLSKQNLDSLYNFVNNSIKQETNINLDSDGKYRDAINKLASNFYHKNKNMNIYHLNNLVLDSVKPIILKNIHKNITDLSSMGTQPVTAKDLLPAPQSVNQTSNLNMNIQALDYDRGTNILSRNKDENKNVMQRMQQIEAERNYNSLVTSANSFDDKLKKAQSISEEKLSIANQAKIDENNEFFKNLYENKIQSNPPDFLKTPAQPNMPPRPIQEAKPPLVESPKVIDYKSDKQEFETSNINVNPQISQLLKDQTDANKVDFKDESKNYDEVRKDRENTQIEQVSKNALDNFYQNDSYVFERRKKKVLTVDISNFLDPVQTTSFVGQNNQQITSTLPAIVNNSPNIFWSDFRINLVEPFVVDKISDVHLESITINNPALATNNSNLYLVIDISEINIKTVTNNIFMKDKFIIPNENTSGSGATAGDNKIMKYHLKSNYVATVNPTTIDSLNIRITNEDNNSLAALNNTNFTSNATVNAGANSITFANDPTGTFLPNDLIYNFQGSLIGTVTTVNDNNANPANALTFAGNTLTSVFAGESLYLSSSRTGVSINQNPNGNGPNDGYPINTTGALQVTPDPTAFFNVGDIVYLSNNSKLGIVTAIDANSITFGSGILSSVPDATQLYTSPPSCVFATNSRNNRVVMELVFVTR